MANYTSANLLKAQLKLAAEFAANDQRYRDPAVFRLFLQSAERFFPNYKALKTAPNRALETNYFLKRAASLGTGGRTHNHTGSGSDSGIMALSWVTYDDKFSTTLKQANNNIYTLQEHLDNEFRNIVINFANGLDAIAGQYAFDNRSGASIGTIENKVTFNGTNDVYETTEPYLSEIATLMKAVADINKYQGGNIDVICDAFLFTEVLRLAAQGAQNATNTSFQFLGTNFVLDPAMGARAIALDNTYTRGFGIVVPRGSVACADWIEQENRDNVETKEQMYGSLINPVDGLQYAVHTYGERADGSGVNGQKQDEITQTEVSIDLSFNHAPSSEANETPLMAFAVKPS